MQLAVATYDAEKGEAVVLAVNRSATEALGLDAVVSGLGSVRGGGYHLREQGPLLPGNR